MEREGDVEPPVQLLLVPLRGGLSEQGFRNCARRNPAILALGADEQGFDRNEVCTSVHVSPHYMKKVNYINV